ncbi:MAG: HXXEE domain-containing protein [Bacteroidota bacterium]|nr:HXXEE domain-containing protein [Bacteroidota bacterium]
MVKNRPIQQVFWLIPAFLALHNLEEALTMPAWIPEHLPLLHKTIPLFAHLQFSPTQLYLSLFLVTVIPFAITFICMRGERTHAKLFILLTLQSIIFWNALMPHVIGLVMLGMYNPGVLTAVVINIPFSVYLLKRVAVEKLTGKRVTKKILLTALVIYLPIVYANHILAQAISRLL